MGRSTSYNRSGRGGHGRGSMTTRSRDKSSKPKSSSRKTVQDHVFYLGTAKAASDYEVAREFLINHICKSYATGNDIAVALETEVEFDLAVVRPILQTSVLLDADQKKKEEEEFKMEYKANMELYSKRKRLYADNKIKAYALLWEQCTRGM